MPSQTQAAPVSLAKLGAKLVKAHNAVKDKPAEFGNAQLPAGINNGIAELRTLKLGTFEKGDTKGEIFFMAMGVVLSPTYHEGLKVEGLQTKIGPIPLCDTTSKSGDKKVTTFEEHYQKMTKRILAPLGFDIENVVVPPGLNEQQASDYINKALANGMAMLVAKKVKFAFRTWAGKKQVIVQKNGKWVVEDDDGKNQKGTFPTKEAAEKAFPYAGKEPLVNHDWNGAVQLAPGGLPSSSSGSDQTGDAPEPNVKTEPAPSAAPQQNDAPAFDEFADDIPTLVARANEDDETVAKPAQDKLMEMADAVGIEHTLDANGDKVYPGNSWDDLGDLITSAQNGGTEDVEGAGEEAAPPMPQVGEQYKYQVLDKDGNPVKNMRTKKTAAPVDVIVKAVDADKGTVKLVNNTDKKTVYNNVPFDQLLA